MDIWSNAEGGCSQCCNSGAVSAADNRSSDMEGVSG